MNRYGTCESTWTFGKVVGHHHKLLIDVDNHVFFVASHIYRVVGRSKNNKINQKLSLQICTVSLFIVEKKSGVKSEQMKKQRQP